MSGEGEGDNLEEEIEKLSHEERLEVTQSSLRRLIAADQLLQHLPGDVTAEEVSGKIAVALGQSITVTVFRFFDDPLQVVIPPKNTTVLDLKKAIQRTYVLRQRRLKSKTKISWKHVWRTYYLQHETEIMEQDNKLLVKYGIFNKSELTFVKKLRRDYRYHNRTRISF